MVIGVNHRSAPVEVRERFWIPEDRRRDALEKLVCTDGIDEVLVLSTGECTEFILWTRDASAASGSVLNFLTREYGLQLCEWKHFYRKLDEAALAHVFLATAGLDSIASREKESTENFKDASVSALQAGTMGRFLDSVAQKTLTISGALRDEATREGLGAAEALSGREAKTFYSRLLQERVVPTIAALRRCLDEICVKELEAFYAGLTLLSVEQRELVEAFAARLTQRIAGTLAHELKKPCEKIEQEHLTSAVQRLFHLEMLQRAVAGANNQDLRAANAEPMARER
jgi:glutamyl-tRNA reductase